MKLVARVMMPLLRSVALVAALIAFTPHAMAGLIVGFQGPYAPQNWTLTDNSGDGSVVTTGAPTSITLFGSNNVIGAARTDFTTQAAGSGSVSFSWAYSTLDSDASTDPFGYLLGGTFTKLTNDSLETESGTISFSVLAGQTFGFAINSSDSDYGRAQSIITSFTAPGASGVPEIDPAMGGNALSLVAGVLAMIEQRRRRVTLVA
jgi:hypothetical protein